MRRMRMNQVIATALADEMRADPDVVIFGEGIAVAEGPFKTSAGLLDTFGPSRGRRRWVAILIDHEKSDI